MSSPTDTPIPEESPRTEVLPAADTPTDPDAPTAQLEAVARTVEVVPEAETAEFAQMSKARPPEATPPADAPSCDVEAPADGAAADVAPSEDAAEETLTAQSSSPEPAAPVADWRTVETPPVFTGSETSADPTPDLTAPPGPQKGDPSQGETSSTPPPVWTAPARTGEVQVPAEPPARGVRVGQLIWSCVVIVVGIFLMALAFIDHVNVPVLLISLVALLGIGLIVAAAITSRKRS